MLIVRGFSQIERIFADKAQKSAFICLIRDYPRTIQDFPDRLLDNLEKICHDFHKPVLSRVEVLHELKRPKFVKFVSFVAKI